MAFTAILYNGGLTPLELIPKNGFVYRDQYNETRDSATIVVRSDAHLDIQPFDFVIISGDVRGNAISQKSLIVDSFREEQVSQGDRIFYETTIDLFSQTKELERVTLPNLSITAKASGQNRSVYDYIDYYLSQYSPQIRVANGSSYSYAACWILSDEVEDRFSDVECPELQWNKPTLYEVINDLMLVADCIPTIKDNVIGFIDLNERKGECDGSGFVREVRSMSSGDYNQTLTINMQNAISPKPAKNVEYISFRNESQAVLTTENMQIVTQKPIYDVAKVTMAVGFSWTTGSGTSTVRHYAMREIDMTDSVKEKMAYDVLSPVPVEFGGTYTFNGLQETHQIANVWYTRGGRAIEGFGKEFRFYNRTTTAFEYILSAYLGSSTRTADIRDIMFKVEYYTYGETTVKIGRKLPLRNSATEIFDGQGSSYVDIGQQSLFEYAKANRLANAVVELNGTYKDESDLPVLGQTRNGAVIFSREIEYFDDLILFHAYAAENYVLANFFTSVRSKRRSWAIASGKEALTRHENFKLYAEFSRKLKTDSFVAPSYRLYFSDLSEAASLLSPLYHYFNDESIKAAMVATEGEDGSVYPSIGGNSRYILDCQASAAGMSMVFSASLTDNYSAGVSMQIDGSGRYLDTLLPYADKNGETSSVRVEFLSYVDPADGSFTWGGYFYDATENMILTGYSWTDNVSDFTSFENNRIAKARAKPVSADSDFSTKEISAFSNIRKDNREILSFTAQIEFCSDDDSIIVTEEFVKRQRLLSGQTESYAGLRVLGSSTITTRGSLPSASEKYANVGLLARLNAGANPMFANCINSGGTWYWQYSSISGGEKFAILDGYKEDTTGLNLGTRVIIGRMRPDGYALIYHEQDIHFILSNTKIKKNQKKVIPVFPSNPPVTITWESGGCATITVPSTLAYEAWGFADEEGNILLAVNKPDDGSANDVIHLNLLRTRDVRIYESVANRQIVARTIIDN